MGFIKPPYPSAAPNLECAVEMQHPHKIQLFAACGISLFAEKIVMRFVFSCS
jgi:hypothetical protein